MTPYDYTPGDPLWYWPDLYRDPIPVTFMGYTDKLWWAFVRKVGGRQKRSVAVRYLSWRREEETKKA